MELNEKQKEFWELYAGTGEYSGNGAKCYAQAYGLDISTDKGYQTAKVNASRLLKRLRDAGYQVPDRAGVEQPEDPADEQQDEIEVSQVDQTEPMVGGELYCIC